MTRMETIGPDPAWLDRLNPEQRAAALHGPGTAPAPPLLILAGAGSGKTLTLAHRLAHLVACGADPGRILLMTYSRRAAAEMTRRAEDIVGAALAQGLTWTGSFHAVAARLLREHAPAIGLPEEFTIHDRKDSADLMNLARHRLGFSSSETRFPAKRTCLAIYSRVVNARCELADALSPQFVACDYRRMH